MNTGICPPALDLAGDRVSTTTDSVFGSDGRLTVVKDTQPNSASTAACTARTYTYDKDSDRTVIRSFPDGAGGGSTGGSCSTGTTPVSATSAFDTANRITSAGYGYDTLGRTVTVPGVDAVGTGCGGRSRRGRQRGPLRWDCRRGMRGRGIGRPWDACRRAKPSSCRARHGEQVTPGKALGWYVGSATSSAVRGYTVARFGATLISLAYRQLRWR